MTHQYSSGLGTTGLNQARIFQFQLLLRIFQPTFSSKYTFFFFFFFHNDRLREANEISISRAYEITRRARKYQKRRPYTRVSTRMHDPAYTRKSSQRISSVCLLIEEHRFESTRIRIEFLLSRF